MAGLVLGPLLRYAGTEDATIWVETDGPCRVEVAIEGADECSRHTFAVHGHHYALLHCTGLQPDGTQPYEVRLDGETVWPEPDSEFPPSVVRTHSGGNGAQTRIIFGSCRVAAPHEPPHSLRKDEHPDGREVDSLMAIAQRMVEQDPDQWPHALLLLGDQVYADEVSPNVKEFIRSRRDPEVPPYETVADFEEYTRLYRESWGEPTMRWLLSTVPSAMIFDDHDVHDDWNTSIDWVQTMRGTGWWDRRIEGGFISYLIYQHWGNLSPDELHDDEMFKLAVDERDVDITQQLGAVLRLPQRAVHVVLRQVLRRQVAHVLVQPIRHEAADDPLVPPPGRAHRPHPRDRRVPVVVHVVVVEDHRRGDGGEQPADVRLRPRLAVQQRVLLEVRDRLPRRHRGVPVRADVVAHAG